MANNGGVQPSKNAVPDTTPRLQDSSLQQGDVAMLREGQKSMKKMQKPATPSPQGSASPSGGQGMDIPDAIDFIGGRVGGSLDAATIGQNDQRVDVARWRPLMEELARDPSMSGPVTTMLLSQLSNMNSQPRTAGVDIIDMNAAEDAVAMSVGL